MNKCMVHIATGLLLLIFVGAFVAAGPEPPEKTGSVDWVSLFDGETLNGWVQKNGSAEYRVEDGAIVGRTSHGSPNSFLCTFNEFGDFELEFDVMLYDNELNSGVQIRSQTREPEGGEEYGRVNGPQVEIESSSTGSPEAGYIYGEAAGGWLVSDEERIHHQAFRDGQWNHYRVVAEGPRIQVWINGQKITDLWHEESYLNYPRGFIGLQVHSISEDEGPYEVAWKNIRIKPL
ncbi:DUF1080 domain-containing protein [Halalkalibaculum sp. DA3122]|uniref:3-keto-disaccharide hydrolase n=1 Tax=unclassified Halalkalibaculum TaxID=2964617 RepID=UPI0037545BFC